MPVTISSREQSLLFTLAAGVGVGLAAGAYLGYKYSQRRLWRPSARPRPASGGGAEEHAHAVSAALVADGSAASKAGGSERCTPAVTPRSLSYASELGDASPPAAADAGARRMRIALLVRDDMGLARAILSFPSFCVLVRPGSLSFLHFACDGAALYKRKSPDLKTWEAGGSQLLVFAVTSEREMLAVQAGKRGGPAGARARGPAASGAARDAGARGRAARALARRPAARAETLPTHTFAGVRGQKHRSVMAVGPAPLELIDKLTFHLKEL
eukprot:scaffold8.g1672.t1